MYALPWSCNVIVKSFPEKAVDEGSKHWMSIWDHQNRHRCFFMMLDLDINLSLVFKQQKSIVIDIWIYFSKYYIFFNESKIRKAFCSPNFYTHIIENGNWKCKDCSAFMLNTINLLHSLKVYNSNLDNDYVLIKIMITCMYYP